MSEVAHDLAEHVPGASVLHDPRSTLRHLFDPRLLSRVTTHLIVVALVVAAAGAGVATTSSRVGSDASTYSFDLVGQAYGAGDGGAVGSVTHFDLKPDPSHPDQMLARRVQRTPPPTPLPTPVAPKDAPLRITAPAAPPVVPAVPVAATSRGGALLWPVPGGIITQYYHPGHLALDIATAAGRPVIASDAGVVTWAGWRNNGGGLVVQVDHGNGIQTVYNHLGAILVGPGQQVGRGQTIARVGCTGSCTGPHVHFEVIVGGVIVNPLRYL